MKISITMSNAEKSYIARTIGRINPSFDQTDMWADMDSKAPPYRSTQITDQAGNFEASLDLNSDFVMDLVDVCCEIVEKVKSFGFMMKGAIDGLVSYSKGVSKRFEKWQTEDQKSIIAARAMYVRAVKENHELRSRDMWIAVAFDGEGKDHAVLGESAEQMSSRCGNMMKDLHTDNVYYFVILGGTNRPIHQSKYDVDKQIGREQANKGKREAAEPTCKAMTDEDIFDALIHNKPLM